MRDWFSGRIWVVMFVAVALLGCATRTPDLGRLYEITVADAVHPPVILIPGAFGSRLRDTSQDRELWPGGVFGMLFRDFAELSVTISSQTHEPTYARPIQAVGLFDQAAGYDFYGRIQDALRDAGGYVLTRPGEPVTDTQRRYYVFPYDWRRDLVKTAAEFDRFIETIRTDHDNPDLRVDIVAHSLGAILMRYYALYGAEDVLDQDRFKPTLAGAAKMRKVVMLGAPNLGTVTALQGMMAGHRIGIARIPVEVGITMPSLYQLLPHPERDWMITPEGSAFSRDLYSVATWRDFGWAVFDPQVRSRIRAAAASDDDGRRRLELLEGYFEKQLVRARRFHRAISVPMPADGPRYVVFGGDCELTPARCLIEKIGTRMVVRLFPEDIVNRVPGVNYHKLMLEPGDGTVTKPSLLGRNALDPSLPGRVNAGLPLAYSILLCEKHSSLAGNISFQDNLLNILLLQETTEDRARRLVR